MRSTTRCSPSARCRRITNRDGSRAKRNRHVGRVQGGILVDVILGGVGIIVM